MAVGSVSHEDTERHHIYTTRYEKVDDTCELHAHARWHLMQCRKGRVQVVLWPHGRPDQIVLKEVGFLDQIEVPAGWWHQVTALENDCYTSCVFDLFDEEGRKLKDPKASFAPGTQVAA